MEPVIFRLQKAIDFLTPHLELVNSHMVEFFTRNLWEELVPVSLRKEFIQEPDHFMNMVDHFQKHFTFNNKKLSSFLKECYDEYPTITDGIILDVELMSKIIPNTSLINEEYLLTKNTFMSEKKEHEVNLMSSIVSILSKFTKSSHVIDIGDGRGYLSSHIAMQKGLKVLGLDCCQSKTLSAVKRATKMQKHLIHCLQKEVKPGDDTLQEKQSIYGSNTLNKESSLSYQQKTAFISPETNLLDYLYDSYPNDNLYNFGIVGLHTCGNLSPSCLKLFVKSGANSKFLVNIGCCYHLLDEDAFPLSKYLKHNNFHLGRNARMLALQAPDRLYLSKKVPDSLLFRAVFEEFLTNKFGHREKCEKEVGRIGSKCKSFEEYCRKGLRKLKLEINVTDSELKSFFETYLSQKPLLEYFYMLRVSIAPVIEHIILLDKLLYLLENGMKNSFILKLFDPKTSPRCFAHISFNGD